MMVALASPVFFVAIVCAALMGFSIQRGATCTVAAVGEIVHDGTARRSVALAEAALWVAGGLLIARVAGLTPGLPSGFSITGWTIVGAVFLGIGAWVNGACVFGSIARFGSGDWGYGLTPLGFFMGAASVAFLFPGAMPVPLASTQSPPNWLAFAFAIFALWRLLGVARKIQMAPANSAPTWAPHEATILIGITFVIMVIGVGPWSYTDLLTRLAHGMSDNLSWRLILFGALLTGATLGGWTAGKLSSRMPGAVILARCLGGGMLMGWGGALIPGSNDGLILIGLPLLMPYAWAAIVVMCATVWIALKAEHRLKHN
jgi:Sulphur transport